MFFLPADDKKALVKAMKEHNTKNPMDRKTYSKLFYPVVKKFIKEHK
jgi:hypothetical protein